MDFLLLLLVGFVQGVTEWLPISSSGQSMLAFINLFKLSPEAAFSLALFLHLGTLLAVLVKMRSDVKGIVLRLPDFREDRLVQFILVSTFFTGVVGVPVYFLLKEGFSGWQGDLVTALIGSFLILTGLLLYSSKGVMGRKVVSGLTFLDMILVGVAQGFSILPGISRSGVTVAVLLFRDIRQEDALRLSFLMSVPAVIGAVFIELLEGAPSFDSSVFLGITAAFISGYMTIDVFLRFASKARFDVFCIVFGLIAVSVYSVSQLL